MNKNTFQIVTDSGANLPDELITSHKIPVISLYFLVDGVEYKSYDPEVKTDNAPFFQMLRDKKSITTSALNREDAKQTLKKSLDQGLDILYIGLSSGISGSFTSVESVINELKDEYPQRQFFAVDSLGAGLGEGALVFEALKMQQKGISLEDVYRTILPLRNNIQNLFTIDTLYYLVKGGRVSKTAGFISSTLNIKPLLKASVDGKIVSYSKTIGRKKSLIALAENTEKMINQDYPQTIYISHGDCLEDALFLKSKIEEKLGARDFVINCLDLVMGSHAGPGMVGVFFVGKARS